MTITVTIGTTRAARGKKGVGKGVGYKIMLANVTLTGTYTTGGFNIDYSPTLENVYGALYQEDTSGLVAKTISVSGACTTVKMYGVLSANAANSMVEIANATSLSGITLTGIIFGE